MIRLPARRRNAKSAQIAEDESSLRSLRSLRSIAFQSCYGFEQVSATVRIDVTINR
jgi:hypothetical protein